MSAEQWVLIQKQTSDIANVTNVLLNIKYVCDEISDSKLTDNKLPDGIVLQLKHLSNDV